MRIDTFLESIDPFLKIDKSWQGRSTFRRRFHYYGKLRDWEDYYSALDYLDAKSTGLLTISGIMTAVYVVFLSGVIGDSTLTAGGREWYYILALLGLFSVSVSLLLFLRCFSVLANQLKRDSDNGFNALEGLFPSHENWLQLEATIDKALEIYSRSLASPEDRTDPEKNEIKAMLDDGHSFAHFDEAVKSSFKNFRARVEAEIIARHTAYTFGAAGVLLSFLCMLLLSASLVYVVWSSRFDNQVVEQIGTHVSPGSLIRIECELALDSETCVVARE